MAFDTLLEPKASDLNQKKTFLFAYEDEFCFVLVLTHQVEILWSGDGDAEQIADVTIISCLVPAADAVCTGAATGGMSAPHLKENVPIRHLSGPLIPNQQICISHRDITPIDLSSRQ